MTGSGRSTPKARAARSASPDLAEYLQRILTAKVYDVVLILQRGRHDVRGCRVKVSAERAPADPKVFTKIHLHFVVTGRAIPAAAVERAVALSHEKYCSATIMLAKTVEITTSFECVDA